MSTKLKCPNCNHEFPLEAALNDELNEMLEKTKQQYREQMIQFKKEKEDAVKEKEQQLALKEEFFKKNALEQEALFIKRTEEKIAANKKELEASIKKELGADFDNKIKMLEQTALDTELKLKTAREKELIFLQKEKALKDREDEMELQLQRQILEEREKLKAQFVSEEKEKFALKDDEHKLRVKELEKQLDDQKKLAEEMRRKAEQGSMQLQGEVQELLLEDLLRSAFPFDLIEEVSKGVLGADCIQTVRNQLGNVVGKIIFESKRTKSFSNEWLEKLKKDKRELGAEIGILVTQTLPKEMEKFGEKDGIFICNFGEVSSVVLLLRSGLLRLYEAKKGQENKGDKMVMLYDYLTSHEFKEQWKAIREGFSAMKLSIQRERDAMEKLWKVREKQLEKVLLNATHIRGSIEGIAGADSVNLSLTDEEDALLLE